MDLTQSERIFLIECLFDYKVQSIIYIHHNGIFEKILKAYCPYCNADNSDKCGPSFVFDTCIYCNKLYKLT